MKKNYISPVVETIEIRTFNLLSGSPALTTTGQAGEGSSGSPVNFSREGRGFGDDE